MFSYWRKCGAVLVRKQNKKIWYRMSWWRTNYHRKKITNLRFGALANLKVQSKLCTSQSKSPPPQPGKGGDIGQKNSKKWANVPTPSEIFSFQCPRLSPPTSEGIFLFGSKCFKPVWFSIFLAETKGNMNQTGCTTTYIGIFYKIYIVYTRTDNKVTLNNFISSFKFILESSSILFFRETCHL